MTKRSLLIKNKLKVEKYHLFRCEICGRDVGANQRFCDKHRNRKV